MKLARKGKGGGGGGGSSASSSGGTSPGGVTAASANPKKLKGEWFGDMSCGNKRSHTSDPSNPFKGDAAFRENVNLKIGRGEVNFMKGVTPKGTPNLNIGSSTI